MNHSRLSGAYLDITFQSEDMVNNHYYICPQNSKFFFCKAQSTNKPQLLYSVEDTPPWYEAFMLGFQARKNQLDNLKAFYIFRTSALLDNVGSHNIHTIFAMSCTLH